jgi:adenylate cyclase
MTEDANERARQMFARAIELDREFGAAYTMVGWTHFSDWGNQWSTDPETLERAFDFARRGLALDDSRGAPHSLLAYQRMLRGAYAEAVAEAELAVRLAPNDPGAHLHLGAMLMPAERYEEAISVFERGTHLDPYQAFLYRAELGWIYRHLGRHREAVAILKQSLGDNPDYLYAHLYLAAAYSELGEEEAARREAEEVLRLNPRFSLAALRPMVAPLEEEAAERFLTSLRNAGLK